MSDYEDQEDKKVTHYLIPANVSTRFEIFEGFGWEEVKYVIFALIFGVVLYIMSGFFTKTEQFNINDMPKTQTIGLRENKNTKIEGDIVTRKKEVIPKVVRFFFIFVPCVGTFIFVRKDPTTGFSLITNLKAAKEFSKKQKRFLFKYNSGG